MHGHKYANLVGKIWGSKYQDNQRELESAKKYWKIFFFTFNLGV